MPIKLSLIIPCFNEEESLPLLKDILTKFKNSTDISFELIFVDDGSKDKTNQILHDLFAAPNVTIVKNEINLNLGGAVRRGIPVCRGEYTAVIDADGSYDPLLLLPMLEIAEKEKYDVISASAHHPLAGFSENTPWWRIFLSRSVQTLYNIVLGTSYVSYTSIFRLYRTKNLQAIKIESTDFMAMAEILAKLVLNNAKILDYPARSNYRQFGVSKAKIKKTIIAHLQFLWKLLWRKVS